MQTDSFSASALISAFARAYHYHHDQPLIFADPLASDWFSDEETRFLEGQMAQAIEAIDAAAAARLSVPADRLAWVMQHFSAAITLSRSRYAEEILRRQLPAQYVLLGAGFDTFAWREPELMHQLKLFCVDHPATAAELERRRLRIGLSLPPGRVAVSCDFNRAALGPELLTSGFATDQPACFSWLGVSYYLGSEACVTLLEQLAQLAAPGSLLVFDFLDPQAFDAPEGRIRTLQRFAERMGEPMLTGFSPDALASLAPGWTLAECLDPAAIQARYFGGRRDAYRAFEHVHFACLQRLD